ncbi:MAG: hypothetical protein GKR91_08525 [Pseudomonadales bacterium]|nr:hypothetical protein [Pseudomonadales bacterium]
MNIRRIVAALQIRSLLFIIWTSTIFSCASVTTIGPTTLTIPTMQVTEADQQNAALAFISYTGDLLDYPDPVVDSILYFCVANELKSQPLTVNKYELVWGPAVYKFEDVELDDNMMFIVRRTETSEQEYVVVIRGTNPTSLSDWIVEDFNVAVTVPWEIPDKNLASTPGEPKISEGTSIGLEILQDLKPEIPGFDPVTVREFLRQRIGSGEGVDKITIVGHSLAGALSPAFALWLSDTRDSWDPDGSTQINVTPIAGPTGGNRDYANYYDSQLAATTRRIHNPEDIVPLAWEMRDLASLPGLYVPNGIEATGPERFLVKSAMDLVDGSDFEHIVRQAPSLSKNLPNPECKHETYLDMAAWQHHYGYYVGLDIYDAMKPLQACAGNLTQLSPPCSSAE